MNSHFQTAKYSARFVFTGNKAVKGPKANGGPV